MSDAMLCSGFDLAQDYKTADIVIVNSCTVTAVSDSKALKLMRRIKRENPSSITVLTRLYAAGVP